ncbi:hypothetical protein WA158_000411 [Blastocystis sp. Blastoise]
MTKGNVLALIIIGLLSLLGALKLYQMFSYSSCNCPLCNGKYILDEYISQGGFGSIYKVYNKKTNQYYALKMIKVDEICDANEAQSEAKRLRELNHNYIVSYYDDFIHEDTTYISPNLSSLYVCIVMELCSTDIETYLLNLETYVDENELYKYSYQIISALQYCHQKNIIHRDIKPSNIFIKENKCKLGDFGLSTQVKNSYTLISDVGTSIYKAPETFLGGEYDGKKADVFSLGLSLLQIIADIDIENETEGGIPAVKLITTPNYINTLISYIPTLYTDNITIMFQHMLDPSPQTRYSTEELLQFPWLSSS